jgi:hypothetical protein
MDSLTTSIKRSVLREERHVFTKAEVMDFIDSFDFSNVEIACEVATSGDEINSDSFVKSFFEKLVAVILEQCPPKISPKKLVERMPKKTFESPLQNKHSAPPVDSSRENTFKPRFDEGTASRNNPPKEEDGLIQSANNMSNFFLFRLRIF